MDATWPPVESSISEAEHIFGDIERNGVDDFKATIDEVAGVIREVVGERQKRWMRRAEAPGDPKCVVANVIGDRRPTRGVPKYELAGQVRQIEPAADNGLFRTALEELIESGELRLEPHEWTGHDGEPTSAECYVLVQPNGGRSVSHSPCFTSVNWFGKRYTFSKGNQAQAIRVLWEEWKRDGHGLSQEMIGSKVESASEQFRLAKVLRKRKKGGGYEQHPAWGTMIQQDGKGVYRLVPPPESH